MRPLNFTVRALIVLRISPVWRLFLLLESIALVAAATYGLILSQLGPFLWTVQLVLLLPGSLLAGPVVEHSLWQTGVGLRTIGILEVLSSAAVNAVLLWAGLFVVRQVRRGSAL